MRYLSWLLTGILALPFSPQAFAQAPAPKLNLVIVEGDGAINNVRQRMAREPIVQVEDENHKPIAGAVVLFELPTRGAGAEFPGGAHSLSVTTDAQGRAVAHGLTPTKAQGQFQIHVTAKYNGATTDATITQTNAIGAGSAAGAAAAGASHAKLIAIIVVVAAAGAGGGYWASHSGGGTPPAANPATTIAAGTGAVGPPR
jgi:hypothetical protein